MKEISNQTLAALVIVSIVISVAGTFMLLNKVPSYGVSGGATGIAKVNVTGVVAISLPVNSVDFGGVYQGYSDNTTDDSPGPLTIQNDGGVDVNVSIARDVSSSPLFSGTGGGDNTSTFQFKFAIGSEIGSFNTGASITTWTNVPGTSSISNVLNELKFQDSTDLAEVDLLIDVPSDEPTGSKNESLVFTASQS